MLGRVFWGKLRVRNHAAIAVLIGVSIGLPISLPTRALAQSPSELSQTIQRERHRIQEFDWLARWGKENGVAVYAAGGTAAGLAHYVKQFIQQARAKEAGQPLPYYESRFGWNYFDLYRSTQDADIVIDGTEADAVKLEKELAERFPYLQGGKSVWEVRLLRYPRGQAGTFRYKDPLIGDRAFHEQHSDSHSTGLVELTDSASAVVRDLADWENETNPRFLVDVVRSELTFYERPTHKQTRRYLDGNNPEVLSAIRALTKAFQYGGRLSLATRTKLKRIIDEYDPTAPLNEYATHQIERNALKLFWHAQDVERAWNELEQLGLRRKLLSTGGAVAIWLDRSPLPTLPLGTEGDTAASLNIDLVSHESNSFLAFENILMSRRGLPNVFRSRDGKQGEAAAFGDGFYTKRGHAGARSTGFTIRFRVKPNARLGHDFTIQNEFVIMKNRAAFDVIDQSLELTPRDYFKAVLDPKVLRTDRGLIEKFERRMMAAAIPLEAPDLAEIRQNISAYVENEKMSTVPPVIDRWIKTGLGRIYPEVNSEILEVLWPAYKTAALSLFWVNRDLFRLPDPWLWFARMIKTQGVDVDDFYRALAPFLRSPDVIPHLEWVQSLLAEHLPDREDAAIAGLFQNPLIVNDPRIWQPLVEALLRNPNVDGRMVLLSALSLPSVLEDPSLVSRYWSRVWTKQGLKSKELFVIQKNSEASRVLVTQFFSQGKLLDKMEEAMQYAVHYQAIAAWGRALANQLDGPADVERLYKWIHRVDQLRLEPKDANLDTFFNGIATGFEERLRSKGNVADVDDDTWMKLSFDLQDRGAIERSSVMAFLLRHPVTLKHPEWVSGYLKYLQQQGKEAEFGGIATQYLARYTFSMPGIEKHPALVDDFLKYAIARSHITLAAELLSSSRWSGVWDRIDQIVKEFSMDRGTHRKELDDVLLSALKKPHAPDVVPELRKNLIRWMTFNTLTRDLQLFDFTKLTAQEFQGMLVLHFMDDEGELSRASKVSLLFGSIRQANIQHKTDVLWSNRPDLSAILLGHLKMGPFGHELFQAWIDDATAGKNLESQLATWQTLWSQPARTISWAERTTYFLEKTTSTFRKAHPEFLAEAEKMFGLAIKDPVAVKDTWDWEQIRDFHTLLVSAHQTPDELKVLEQKIDQWFAINHEVGTMLTLASLRSGLFPDRATDWIFKVAGNLHWYYKRTDRLLKHPPYDPRSNLSNLLNTMKDKKWDAELRRFLGEPDTTVLTPELLETKLESPGFWVRYQALRLKDRCNDLLGGKKAG